MIQILIEGIALLFDGLQTTPIYTNLPGQYPEWQKNLLVVSTINLSRSNEPICCAKQNETERRFRFKENTGLVERWITRE